MSLLIPVSASPLFFVLTLVLRPLVVLKKADRATSRPAEVESDPFDLFATLGATDEQADNPLLYASAKQGWAQDTLPTPSTDPTPLVPTGP